MPAFTPLHIFSTDLKEQIQDLLLFQMMSNSPLLGRHSPFDVRGDRGATPDLDVVQEKKDLVIGELTSKMKMSSPAFSRAGFDKNRRSESKKTI